MIRSKSTPDEMAKRILLKELRELTTKNPEGFTIKCDERNLLEWTVGIFGVPDSPYQGGYFKARLRFPSDFPFVPPSITFTPPLWHPNIYRDGVVCISTLHTPGHDPQSGEHASERWNPTQTVRSVIMSVISMLDSPNVSSPANVDASVMYRKWKESGGQDSAYVDKIKAQVEQSKAVAKADGVQVPTNRDEYCVKTSVSQTSELESWNSREFGCPLSDPEVLQSTAKMSSQD